MPNSEQINYALRPAKHVERKMLLEAFRRLSEFGRLEDYRYIGFGAAYFRDFHLFHRALNIKKMYSIEWNKENRRRYIFNRPFSCIRIKFGSSTELLPTFEWEQKTILWLDYTSSLSLDILSDIQHICTFAKPGSVLIVSVNAEPDRYPPSLGGSALVIEQEKSLERLKERLGKERIPLNLESKDLRKWGTAQVYRTIINNQINAVLKDRNGILPIEQQIQYHQIFNFHYADGAQMLTVGGLLLERRQEYSLLRCRFDELDFTRFDNEPYLIQIPNLTYRELKLLDRSLPTGQIQKLKKLSIPEEDLNKYAKIYRYFPTFAETEF